MKRFAGVGQCDRDRTGVEVEHASGIQRVAVHAHDRLLIDGRQRPVVVEIAEAAELDDVTEIEVGLGAREVLDRDRGCRASRVLLRP
jgi:hypothetical protein